MTNPNKITSICEPTVPYEQATDKPKYGLTNDYMFRAVFQKNPLARKGLIASVLHMNPTEINSVDILNPIEIGAHMGILNFTPFPEFPEFSATYKLLNVKNHIVYSNKFTIQVIDLTHIELATEEDKAWNINYWARLFTATTREDVKMIAEKDIYMEAAAKEMYKFSKIR